MSSTEQPTIFVTGATGKLGNYVIDALLERVPASRVAAGIRDEEEPGAAAMRDKGITLRVADYERADTLDQAFAGIERLLLISSNALGKRAPQHRRVIEAAKKAGVKLLIYTSLLHADQSPLSIADEHRETEADLKASDLPFVILRNNWYNENYTDLIELALKRGVFLGAAGDGRIASASRADYAEAAAVVLVDDGHAGQVYELAGDNDYSLAEFVASVAEATGRELAYEDIDAVAYEARLGEAGLPDGYAKVLADADTGAAKGALFDDSRTLSRLIGRPTISYRESIKAAT